MKSVFLTSTIFTLWHVGVWEPSVWIFAQIFFASILLGLIYLRSGSIAAVAVLHAIYDAIFAFTPLIAQPLNENWGFLPLLAALGLVAWWALAGWSSGAGRVSVRYAPPRSK